MTEEDAFIPPNTVLKTDDTVQSKCPSCGGYVVYSPEEEKLLCEYCGAKIALDMTPSAVHENDLNECLEQPELYAAAEDYIPEVTCAQCGASTTFPENTTSFSCAFCGTPIVLKNSAVRRAWKPEYILPFKIGRKVCNGLFRKWVSSLWFAPTGFAKNLAAEERMKGVYLPYWTYDANTVTRYTGQRGMSRTVMRTVNGRKETQIVTDWYPASGTISHAFDDVLTPASDSLPRNVSRVLTKWDRENYVAYSDQFVRGFLTELYRRDFKACYPSAKAQMEDHITAVVRADIGGNQQRIFSQNTTFSAVKFKHILLPLWISAYRYNNKTYVFAINGRTGQVAGQRPWSVWKIALLVIAVLAILIAIYSNGGA
ncbi:MAG: hypothetical protein LBR06_08990 [Bacteroidales bacterium]|jgi:predicted RNA-binding Zn-ribbon protein involved in translation (DUF1610 family)|nr:hypothetical protein [Bacteroidales bacterium]